MTVDEFKAGITEDGFCKGTFLAGVLGLTERRIQMLAKEGVLKSSVHPVIGSPAYSLIESVQAYTEFLRKKTHGNITNATEQELKEAKLKAEIAWKEGQVELQELKKDLTQLEADIAQGKYLLRDEVEADYKRFFTVAKKTFLAMTPRLAGNLSGIIDPLELRRIERELHDEICGMLEGFVVAGVTEMPAKRKRSTK